LGIVESLRLLIKKLEGFNVEIRTLATDFNLSYSATISAVPRRYDAVWIVAYTDGSSSHNGLSRESQETAPRPFPSQPACDVSGKSAERM